MLKTKGDRGAVLRVTDDEHPEDMAMSEYSHAMEHEEIDAPDDCGIIDCPTLNELTIENEKESMEREVSAMIAEYMDHEKLEDGSAQGLSVHALIQVRTNVLKFMQVIVPLGMYLNVIPSSQGRQ
ncbi:hypothetical protein EUGRSUZ_F04215 [Eucalyptus grandis]|uniref:Uncharacterized protein n=2 Tax=Eucalyptus grandis TaxID=71139 RepID=A0ACC3KRE5_EUCGR|nr:hypothetical protein EUGRSUZ_F04215 [Eucalyptus grandis]